MEVMKSVCDNESYKKPQLSSLYVNKAMYESIKKTA